MSDIPDPPNSSGDGGSNSEPNNIPTMQHEGKIKENFAASKTMEDAAIRTTGNLPGDSATTTGFVQIGTALPQLSGERVDAEIQFRILKGGTFPGSGSVEVTIGYGDEDDARETVVVDAEEIAVAGAPGKVIRVPLPAVDSEVVDRVGFSVTSTGDFSGAKYVFGIAT